MRPRSSRHLRIAISLLMLAMFAVAGSATLISSQNAAAYSAISVEFDRPSYAGVNETIPCTLTIRGGPAGDIGGNFSYVIEADGENTEGFVATPESASSDSGVFKLNLTMPEEAGQTITVLVTATSKDYKSGDVANETFEFRIKVVTPIVITAEVFNIGDVDALGVTASFFADGELIGTKEFSIASGDSKLLQYNWTFASINSGKHTVTVSIDDEDDIVEFTNGNNVYTLIIYVGDQSNIIGGVLMSAVVVLAVIVTLTYFQKPVKKKKF